MRRNMKKRIILILSVLLLFLMAGCRDNKEEKPEIDVYYVNMEGNTLTPKKSACAEIEEAFELLKKPKDISEVQSVIPKEVELEKYVLKNRNLNLYFNKAYREMSKSTEVLMRAGIVQTMVQLDGIDFVTFYIEDELLRDGDGVVVGMMRSEDFVQSTGSSVNSYLTSDLKLYFSSTDGVNLKAVKKNNIHYNPNTAMEKLVVEQLMKGTNANGCNSTIPQTTKLLGVSVKEGICYVNFDSQFLNGGYDQSPEVTIYSIVNSVIENGSVAKVQISVDGTSDIVYKNKVDLSKPLEFQEELIEEQNEK